MLFLNYPIQMLNKSNFISIGFEWFVVYVCRGDVEIDSFENKLYDLYFINIDKSNVLCHLYLLVMLPSEK